jgi:hypothetical protein
VRGVVLRVADEGAGGSAVDQGDGRHAEEPGARRALTAFASGRDGWRISWSHLPGLETTSKYVDACARGSAWPNTCTVK